MMPQSLRALLEHVIDYAGLYPPASLPISEVVQNYERYRNSPEAWMLNRLVLPENKLRGITAGDGWRVTLLVEREPAQVPRQVETFETKSGGRLSLPTYCEVPLDQVADGYAKTRTTDPSPEVLADFLCSAAAMRKPFKATAGLHHPMRSTTMHGFLNVFAAATFAWSGMDRAIVGEVLADMDATAFTFEDDGLRWRGRVASVALIEEARRDFAHSFGSCSFEEPVDDLRAMGLLK
jgi:hypothetical protein